MASPDTNKDGQSTAVSERRTSSRSAAEIPLRVELKGDGIEGLTQNMSSEGIYFFADQVVEVTVNIAGREVQGRVVRLEQVNDQRVAIAVKFDESFGGPSLDRAPDVS